MAGKMARDIKDFEAKVRREADNVVENFVFGLYGEIIRRTPVAALNGGRARGSWELATSLSNDSRTTDGPKNRSGVARKPPGLKGMVKKSDSVPIYISSCIPYIVPLENGHSQQASPGFMVRGSVKYVVSQFRQGK